MYTLVHIVVTITWKIAIFYTMYYSFLYEKKSLWWMNECYIYKWTQTKMEKKCEYVILIVSLLDCSCHMTDSKTHLSEYQWTTLNESYDSNHWNESK